MKHILIPIYDSDLYFVTTPEEFDSTCEDHDIEDRVEEYHAGLFAQGTTEEGSKVYVLGCFDSTTGTLVHELSHLCLDIIEYRGFSAHDGNGEPFCHLIDWLYREVTSVEATND